MKTPVIIPAYNEERNIARVLNSLPADLVEPLVAVNGSTDKTVAIAESFGAEVLDIEEQGKLPAIQYALKHLGTQALDPLLLLDADAYPRKPKQWHNRMLSLLQENSTTPRVVSGVHWFTARADEKVSPVVRSLFVIAETLVRSGNSVVTTGLRGGQYGPNMGVHIIDTDRLENVLELPHYWNREDRALTNAIVRNGGIFKQSLHSDTVTFTPESESFPPILDVIKYGFSGLASTIDEAYSERGAPGSVPFEDI